MDQIYCHRYTYNDIIYEIESSKIISCDTGDIKHFENTIKKYELHISMEDIRKYYIIRDNILLSDTIGVSVYDLFEIAIDNVIKYGEMSYLTECIDKYQHLLSFNESNMYIETWNELNIKLIEENAEMSELIELIEKQKEMELINSIENMSIE